MGLGITPRRTEKRRKRDDRDSGVRLWEEDVWKQIVFAALSDSPGKVEYAFRREMQLPARSRYSPTRPAVLNWFKRYNEGRPYAEQVKPLNFLLTFFVRRQEDLATEDPTHGFDPNLDEVRPVGPRSDRICFVRHDAAQDGDEGSRSEHQIHRRPPSRAMRKSPRAAARRGAAQAEASSAAKAAR
jgi:hypothetical protein